MTERPRTRTRAVIGTALALTTVCVVAGCSHGLERSSDDPADAERSVVEVVDESSDAVGGEWTVYRGPAAEVCTRPGGAEGARFVYIVERTGTAGADPAADIGIVERLWQGAGITTERVESGGADPLAGIRGDGGPVTSVGFNAYPQRYSITGVSPCSDGDVVKLRGSGTD